MYTFLHVDDNAGQPDTEHPRQGALAVLKLVAQPPTQLPETLSSFASFTMIDVGAADDVSIVDDLWRGTALRATARCFGFLCLGISFGASTVILGSALAALAEGVAVCEIAVLLRPHVISAMPEQATARLDKDLMAMSSQRRASQLYQPPLN